MKVEQIQLGAVQPFQRVRRIAQCGGGKRIKSMDLVIAKAIEISGREAVLQANHYGYRT